MTKWVLDQWSNGPLDYPTLGFTASPGNILIASAAPDSRWSLNGDQGAAETVTRYTLGADPNYVEPTNGHVLVWSDVDNTYVPADPETAFGTFLSATYAMGQLKVVYVSEDGNDAWSGLVDSRPKRTLTAALAAVGLDTPGVIRCAPNVIDCGSGVSLSGYACGIVGTGYGYHETTATMKGTVLKATAAQTGPVLDLTGWKVPGSARGRVEFGNFSVEGDGVADATKTHKGVSLGAPTIAGVWFHDITVWKTGGAGFDFGAAELVDFDRIVVHTPVSAKANDVPYMTGAGAMNCNRFNGLGFRSTTASNDTGVSGALFITDDGTFAPGSNEWNGLWFEYLHVPTGGCLVGVEGNENLFWGTQFVDCSKEAGATGTTHYRFGNTGPGTTNAGGNSVRGRVPSGGDGTGVYIDSGIEFNQSNNSAVGVKDWMQNNVIIGAGIERCVVVLDGSVATATGVAVVDNSGNNTNVVIDHSVATHRWGVVELTRDTTNDGVTVKRTDGGAPGITLRSGAGPRWVSSAANTDIHRSDSHEFQAIDGTPLGYVDKFAGWQFKGNLGFYGAATVAKPTVTGSRGGNAALASLLTALASQGLITDSSSA